jgi:hypothetical protein
MNTQLHMRFQKFWGSLQKRPMVVGLQQAQLFHLARVTEFVQPKGLRVFRCQLAMLESDKHQAG